MIAVDTNILVRIFVDDLDHAQIEKARNLAQKAKHIYIAQIVLAELVWVLTRAYQLTKAQICCILQELLDNSAFIIEQEQQFLEALITFKENNTDFSDCLILAETKAAGIEHIYTFDAKFSRLKSVKKL
ncbi:MAG TPA: type II toxin-antitoxin system VapC family toxin [Gammaproteobacteria bacterium]|nr:type II toxin-antitoxin system VapC family toxin [Gammaproteobacteria bacterium]